MRISRIGGFGRKLAAGETVDSKSGHHSGLRTGQRGPVKFGRELVGIVGKSIEILTFEDQRAGVVLRAYVYIRGGIGDDYFLLLRFNFQLNV